MANANLDVTVEFGDYFRGVLGGMVVALDAASGAAHAEGQTLEGLTEAIDESLRRANEKYEEYFMG